MKALGMATGLVLALVGTIIVWSLASGSRSSGEPIALLQINNKKNIEKTALARSPLKQDAKGRVAGRQEVMLDVTPGRKIDALPSQTAQRRGNHGLVEPSKFGLLPKRAKDGRSPASVWARHVEGSANTMPRIAVLFTGLGLNQGLSRRAMKSLPAKVTLAFSPYGRTLGPLVEEAGRQGHEMMLQVPLEPHDYPTSDTGPKTLLVDRSMKENRSHLHWALGRFTGYFGVVNAKGGRYLANKNAAGGLFRELQRRGLYFFRDHAAGSPVLLKLAEQVGLGYSQATLEIDRNPSKEGVMQALEKLEAVARRSGIAVGVARMHPISIDLVARWAKRLESRGLMLVPVSAVYERSRS